MTIHPTAIIDPSAKIAANVTIGPFTTIGPNCVIGEGCTLGPHVVLEANTTMGKNCQISAGAVLGGLPQDLGFKNEETYVVIGDNVVIREYTTINRATGVDENGRGKATVVGSGCFIMAYSHLAHNCELGKEVILANNTQLAGYVTIGDQAFISGTTAFHQFVRVGRLAILGGFSATRQDIPPFSMCDGRPATIVGINKVGLRRRGYSAQERDRLRRAVNLIWFSSANTREGIDQARQELGSDPLLEELITFIETSKRGIRRPTNLSHDFEPFDSNPLPASPLG